MHDQKMLDHMVGLENAGLANEGPINGRTRLLLAVNNDDGSN